MSINKDWTEPLMPISDKIRRAVEWYKYPNILMLCAIFHVNLSLLRRFHPHLTILCNDEHFEECLPSPSVKYQRIPLSY